jgi:hypothetical protein
MECKEAHCACAKPRLSGLGVLEWKELAGAGWGRGRCQNSEHPRRRGMLRLKIKIDAPHSKQHYTLEASSQLYSWMVRVLVLATDQSQTSGRVKHKGSRALCPCPGWAAKGPTHTQTGPRKPKTRGTEGFFLEAARTWQIATE